MAKHLIVLSFDLNLHQFTSDFLVRQNDHTDLHRAGSSLSVDLVFLLDAATFCNEQCLLGIFQLPVRYLEFFY